MSVCDLVEADARCIRRWLASYDHGHHHMRQWPVKALSTANTDILRLWILAVLVSTCCNIDVTLASVGDHSPAYRTCMGKCRQDTCEPAAPLPYDPPLSLRWASWTCEDDCSYRCMHNLTNAALDTKMPFDERVKALDGLPPRVVQYHGKWPFYRLFGVQEPMSVLFSLGNMYMHLKHGFRFRKQLPRAMPWPLRRAYKLLPLIGINLWIWSTVFHTRDRPWTEKLDYFSAALSMLFNLYIAVVRLGGFYPPPNNPRSDRGKVVRPSLAMGTALVFILHTSYLTFWRFDYGYNMAFNVCIGLLHNCLWYAWGMYHYVTKAPLSRTLVTTRPITSDALDTKTRAPHYWRPAAVLTLFSAMLALELLDFAPFFRILDAHALWHASTITIVRLWYQALLEDARWICGDAEASGEHVRLGISKRNRMA